MVIRVRNVSYLCCPNEHTMTPIEQVREALERSANDLSPNNLPIDATMEGPNGITVRRVADRCFDDICAAIAILKDMDGQEPVAWMDPSDGNVLPIAVYNDRVPEGRSRYTIPVYATHRHRPPWTSRRLSRLVKN